MKGKKELNEEEKFTIYEKKLKENIQTQEAHTDEMLKQVLEMKLLGDGEDPVDPADIEALLANSSSLRPLCDEETEKSVKRDLKLMESILGKHVVGVTKRLAKVLPNDVCCKTWRVEVCPCPEEFSEVLITMQLSTIMEKDSKQDLPRVRRLQLEVTGLEEDTELEAVLQYCARKLEPQLAVRLVAEYLPLDRVRAALLSSHTGHISGNVVEFARSGGSLLANLCLVIQPDWRSVRVLNLGDSNS